ncbi:hypothetical protein F5B20DRAFT_525004 [Whalleya microplaca]|nr:hypothetical protein F5B20DRAFT_525004 [Whalleya microplaca]
MQFTTAITTLFALAASVIAAPSELNARTGTPSYCTDSSQQQVCCNALALDCVVQVLGSVCTTESYCCQSNEAAGTLVNVNALNCIHL